MADYGDHSGLCSQEGAPLFSAEDAISTMASETEFLVDKEVVIPQEATNRPAGDRTSVLGRLLPNSTACVTQGEITMLEPVWDQRIPLLSARQ